MRSDSNRSKTSRLNLRRLLSGIVSGGNDAPETKRGRLLLESLERRQLLAGDVELLFTDGADAATNEQPAETDTLTSTRAAEGELAPDLVQFAKDLDASGTVFYGAHWCPACTQQKELFADGKDDLPFEEVTNPDRSLNALGTAQGITEFPTWVFPDNSRLVGVQSLETLSQRSGVAIPQSEQPTFVEIGDTTVQIGSPLHIPVDAYDPDGGPLTVTVSVDDPTLLNATVITGNRSIRVDMAGYGDMVFELFEQRAPTAAGRVADLAEDGFYDGIIFHRIVDGFVIQAGDPTGTGTSGSSLGNFDDDFHPDLQHNRPGVLSFAKSADDTNNSQFFITEVPTRFLDFNHSIFGQLVEGEDVREAISSTATPASEGTGSSQRPDNDIVINTIEVFQDTENSVIMLKPTGNATGSTNVTVTVTDQDGNTHSETFLASVVADTANSQPFLNDITQPPISPVNTPSTLQLTSIDVEGDAVTYFAQSSSAASNGTVSVDPTTGLVTVTPASGFAGTINVQVGVQPGPGVVGNSSSDFDSQAVSFVFQGAVLNTPLSVDLEAASDSGFSDTDNQTNEGSLTFTVDGVTDGATVELVEISSGSVIGFGAATGSTVAITTNNIAALGDGTYQISARQRDATNASGLSSPITIVYDTTAPASVVASAATQANLGTNFQTDLVSDEEGSGLRYALTSAPDGATINVTTGLIDWAPQSTQTGSNTFALTITDATGNARSESFDVNVAGEPVIEIKLELTDLQGAAINSVAVGDEFLMRFIGVDARNVFTRDGVFAAFADVLFDSSLVRPVPGSSIEYDSRFPVVQSGTFSDGLIDELGAATDRLVASQLEESLILTVRFEALAAGTVNIRSEPADLDASESLVYGLDDVIPAGAIAFGSASLAIGQSFIIADDNFTVSEDATATTLDVRANDQIVSGTGSLSIVSVSSPTAGGTAVVEAGEVVFTPDPDFNGQVEFTYRVSDSNGIQEDASVTVTVSSVNDPPTGVVDTFNVDQNSTDNTLNVIGNDIIAPDSGETLTIDSVTTPSAGGTITISSDSRTVNYTPPAGFTGTDTFSYTVTDGELTDTVAVSVTVAPVDNPPTAVDDSFAIIEDDAEAAFDVLTNDTRDTDNQEFVLDTVGLPNNGGAARISDDGTQIIYSPAANFNGTETVTYTIRDTGGGLSVGTVNFNVTAVNDAPPVSDFSLPVSRGNSEETLITISDLPSNVDAGETLTFTNLGTPTAGGTVRIANGAILYTPPSTDFTGTDTFTFDVIDGAGLTSSGTITVDVLEFAARNISLTFDANTPRIGGVMLTGTNALGETIAVPLSYGSDDSAAFRDVLPGTFNIEIPAIPFLQNASEAQFIEVTSLPEDGDVTVDANVGQLAPEFVSIRDFLGSSPLQSLLLAVEPGESSLLAIPGSTNPGISNAVAELNAEGTTLTIRGTDDTGADVEATLPATSDARVQLRGTAGSLQLLRVDLTAVSFEPAPLASTVSGAGESIAAVQQAPAAPLGAEVAELNVADVEEAEVTEVAEAPAIELGGRQAEGESVAAQSVTVADIFVPTNGQASAQSNATVLPLSSGDVWVGESLTEQGDKVVSAADSVDTAMSDVAGELSLVSSVEAVGNDDDTGLDQAAIDAALTGELS